MAERRRDLAAFAAQAQVSGTSFEKRGWHSTLIALQFIVEPVLEERCIIGPRPVWKGPDVPFKPKKVLVGCEYEKASALERIGIWFRRRIKIAGHFDPYGEISSHVPKDPRCGSAVLRSNSAEIMNAARYPDCERRIRHLNGAIA
jgi:hypothetical protein